MQQLKDLLKDLPWRWLIQSSVVANLVAVVLEVLLVISFARVTIVQDTLGFLLSSPLMVTLLPILATVGVGALSVYLLEIWQQEHLLNQVSLWALVGCLFLVLLVKSFLPLPAFLATLSGGGIVSVLIGVFWKGRPYWRYH
ncbi:MAG: peptide chain release factor 1 [Microcoleaceae cyanobacterium]